MRESVTHLRELKKGEVGVGMHVKVIRDGGIISEGVVTYVYSEDDPEDFGFKYGEDEVMGSCGWITDIVYLIEELGLPESNSHHDTLLSKSEWTDKHYDHYYTLTPEDIAAGKIKIDPYFVNTIWGINDADKTGAAFHNLKTLSRMAKNKNTLTREWDAMIGQSTRARQLMKGE